MLNVKSLPSFVGRLATSNATLNTRSLSSLRQAEVDAFHEHSGLHKINTTSKNPIDIFSKWYSEHMAANGSMTSAKAFSLATVSNTGKVSCRSLILRRLDEDGFVMMTDGRSRKSKDLAENPQASMLFFVVRPNIR
uniref:pyridoxal 5'-phosphate synthase n=1 Tax=Acyrthosiphon pisum TaxID=7029 RepID=C4WTK8_ACYPI|nr:ACYPI005823 [Acyrthosiphon pisum]